MTLDCPPSACRFFPDFEALGGVPYCHRPARVGGEGTGVYDQVADAPSLALLGDLTWPVVTLAATERIQ